MKFNLQVVKFTASRLLKHESSIRLTTRLLISRLEIISSACTKHLNRLHKVETSFSGTHYIDSPAEYRSPVKEPLNPILIFM